jgi:hypothetical protein
MVGHGGETGRPRHSSLELIEASSVINLVSEITLTHHSELIDMRIRRRDCSEFEFNQFRTLTP